MFFRILLLEEYFTNNNNQISLEGPLYLKSESKKGWKRYHFVLRPSGLYYYTKEKEKARSSKDLMCLALFNAHNVYKGFGWKKKFKAPTDFGLALKCPKVNMPGKGMKMLCAEDAETLEKWIMCCRIAKYGKKIAENYKNLIDDLAREDLDKIASTRLSFTPIASSINADKLSVCSSQNGRLSRASTSSSSSGCLSDDNNGFENEFTTGTIKRKPTMKANLPLTSKTRQLIKEVDDSSARNDESNEGTLTRRRTHSSSSNGTLKRQGSVRCSFESMKTPPTPEEPFKSIAMKTSDSIDSGKLMQSCMTDSMLSLPPPPPEMITNTCVMSASTLSLNSLPLPEPPDELTLQAITKTDSLEKPQGVVVAHPPIVAPQPIYNGTAAVITAVVPEIEPIYKTILKAPPYKSPPPVKNMKYALPPPVPQKTVSFVDSPQSPPVVMRKKVCFEDQIEKIPLSPTRSIERPPPPVRAVSTQLSNGSSPKRLVDSACNPPQDFWKDLQRVMNKKLGVAQKCKMNLQISPGEVLGFRDFDPSFEGNANYREASTTNWVIEHYGDALYENWNGSPPTNGNVVVVSNRNSSASNGTTSPVILRDAKSLPLSPQRRSQKPPPPVPVRTCSRLSTNSNEMQ